MARRKRKNKYPGLTVFREKRVGTLLVKWIDPQTGKKRQESLSKQGYASKDEADRRLRKLSRKVMDERRVVEIEGRRENAGVEWPVIIKTYLAQYAQVHSEKSKKRTEHALYPLKEWLAGDGRRYRVGGDLNRLGLLSLHDWLGRLRQRVGCKGPRGKHEQTDKPLSNASLNNYRAAIVALLHWARKREYFRITGDDIRDTMPKFRERRPLPVEVSPAELEILINAVVEHDTDRCHGSRADKHAYYSGVASPEAELRYKPLAPLALLLMLTGMRLGEALHVRWDTVDFERKFLDVRADESSGWDVKTRHERRVPFGDSPALERLLLGLRLRRGENQYVIAGDEPGKARHFSRYSWDKLFDPGQRAITPKMLRSTFATALACARGGPMPYELAHRLGHSVEVAARNYIRQSDPRAGTTVEEWLGVRDKLDEALDALGYPKVELANRGLRVV